MAVKFVSQEKQSSKTSKAKHSEVTQIVDKMTELRPLYNKAKKTIKEFDGLKSDLKNFIPPDADPAEPVTFVGTELDGVFTAQSQTRHLTDVRLLHEMLGDDVFYSICKVSLTDVDKYLSEDEQECLVKKQRDGARNFSLKMKD